MNLFLFLLFLISWDGVRVLLQTRNPTHAGHAYLMKTGLSKLKEKGFKRPLLWLSPLGG